MQRESRHRTTVAPTSGPLCCFACIIIEVVCSHLHDMWPLVLLSLESYTVHESSKGSKTASAMIVSPAPTGKSRSQPSKRIRSLSTLVVTEAASGLQPCVKIDISKLVMLTQLDVLKTGRGGGRLILPKRCAFIHPSRASLSSLFRAILSSRFYHIHWQGRFGMCRWSRAFALQCLSRKGHHCRSPVGARAKACTHPTFSRVLVDSSPLEPCLPLA